MQARRAGGNGWDDLKGTHKSAGDGLAKAKVGPFALIGHALRHWGRSYAACTRWRFGQAPVDQGASLRELEGARAATIAHGCLQRQYARVQCLRDSIVPLHWQPSCPSLCRPLCRAMCSVQCGITAVAQSSRRRQTKPLMRAHTLQLTASPKAGRK